MVGGELCDERIRNRMAAQLLGREGKKEKQKKEKNESDEDVEKKQKVMVEETGDPFDGGGCGGGIGGCGGGVLAKVASGQS